MPRGQRPPTPPSKRQRHSDDGGGHDREVTVCAPASEAEKRTAANIASLYEDASLCDGEVKLADGRILPVSRMVLAASSPFFKAAFSGHMREGASRSVTIPELSSACVEALLRYAHSKELRFPASEL